MQKAIDIYRPDMDQSSKYQSAKRTLIEQTFSQTPIIIPCDERSGALMERVECGNIDDDEFTLWLSFCSEQDGDDWWLDDVKLRISLLCADLREHQNPDTTPVTLLIEQPELTEHFHRNLKYPDKLAIIPVIFGNIAYKIAQKLHPPKEPRLQSVLNERFDALQREIWDDNMPPRTRFDVL